MSENVFKELCGVLHIHTVFSDGSLTFPGVIKAAGRAGLDFIIINDHMTLRGKQEGYEGFNGSLMVLVGYEHHDSSQLNHYLAIGVEKVEEGIDRPQAYIDAIKRDGGIGFLAHPMERRHYFKRYPPFPWTEWNVKGYDGIEIWNQMSEWVENLKKLTSFVNIFYPRRLMKTISPLLLSKWDELNRYEFVSGIGGVDAHTRRIGLKFLHVLELFPINVELKGIRTHLLINEGLCYDNPKSARQIILNALRDGHGFVSNYRRGNAQNTRIFVKTSSGAILPPGKPSQPTFPPLDICTVFPVQCEIRLMRNGKPYQTAYGKTADFKVNDTGVFRIEAFVGKNAWIYSNPIPVGRYPIAV
jgi:hypothetical protein